MSGSLPEGWEPSGTRGDAIACRDPRLPAVVYVATDPGDNFAIEVGEIGMTADEARALIAVLAEALAIQAATP